MNKVAIGFHGGGGISVRLEDDELSALRSALSAGGGWRELNTADGKVNVKLDDVVYVSTDSGEHKVGFRGLG